MGRFLTFGLAAITTMAPASLAAASADTKKNAETEKVICRTTYSSTSRMGAGRVCMTKAEWDEQRRMANKKAGEFAPNGTNRSNGGVSGMSDLSRPGGPR